MARSSDRGGPRFRHSSGRRRDGLRLAGLLALGSLAIGAGLASANAGRLALRCIDGRIEARRGAWLPWGESALDDPLFVPLTVPEALCRDSVHASNAALERAYLETAVAAVEAAIAGGSSQDLERSLAALELVLGSADERIETQALERRRRALLLSRLRMEIDQARSARERALSRLEQARDAGLDESELDQLESELVQIPTPSGHGDRGDETTNSAAVPTRSSERSL